MSMHPQAIPPISEKTARVARAALPHSNTYLTMRDQLGILYEDQTFSALFSERGRPAEVPWQVALVCVYQFLEGLSNRQAAEAVRTRIDWKYALSLELADPDFDFSVLSKFRSRLLAQQKCCCWKGCWSISRHKDCSHLAGSSEQLLLMCSRLFALLTYWKVWERLCVHR